MCLCMYVCVCMYERTYVCVRIDSICTYLFTYVCIHIFISFWIHSLFHYRDLYGASSILLFRSE